jgi:hypothetical protein
MSIDLLNPTDVLIGCIGVGGTVGSTVGAMMNLWQIIGELV